MLKKKKKKNASVSSFLPNWTMKSAHFDHVFNPNRCELSVNEHGKHSELQGEEAYRLHCLASHQMPTTHFYNWWDLISFRATLWAGNCQEVTANVCRGGVSISALLHLPGNRTKTATQTQSMALAILKSLLCSKRMVYCGSACHWMARPQRLKPCFCCVLIFPEAIHTVLHFCPSLRFVVKENVCLQIVGN